VSGGRQLGLLVAPAAVVAGILVGESVGPGAGVGALAGVAAALAVVLLTRTTTLRTAAVVFACALLACASVQRALDGLARSPLTGPVAAATAVTVAAALVDDPGGGRWDATVLVRAGRFRTGARPWRDAGGRRLLVSAGGDVASRIRVLAAGDRVKVRGWLEPLRGLDRRARWQHAVGTLHATALLGASGPRSLLTRAANTMRGVVLAGAQRLSPVDGALLSGFLVGDSRGIPYALAAQFRAAGLTHLLAVSGENVAFVLALFAPVFRRVSLRARLVGAGTVLVIFGAMTRWEPSVLRAITMAAIALVAGYLGRPTAGLRVLALAGTVLLIADPFLLHSVGFLLSCGASLGIALLSRPIAARLRGPRFLRDALAVTAAAQVGVAPVLVPLFGSIPLVSLPANLFAVPLAAPLTVWGLAAGVVCDVVAPTLPGLASIVQLPTVGLLHAVIAIADIASRAPVAVDGRALVGLVALGALVAAGALTRRLRRDARDGLALPARARRPRPHVAHTGDGNPQPHS
jgi:competence protein ComEC